MAPKGVKRGRDSSDLIDMQNKRRAAKAYYSRPLTAQDYMDTSGAVVSTPTPPSPTSASDIAAHLKQTKWTAYAALDFYNEKHHTNYKIVNFDNSGSGGCGWNGGVWFHVNFEANLETSSESSNETDGESSTQLFFAELKVAEPNLSKEFLVSVCCPIETKSTEHCEICEGGIVHPRDVFHQGMYLLKQRELSKRRESMKRRQNQKGSSMSILPKVGC